jgi:FixJ family two-component response regulator
MSKRSILVVDDDKSTRDYLAAFLGASGYSIECLESGERGNRTTGLRVLSFDDPAGRNASRERRNRSNANIKAIYPTIPIIILSGIGQIKTVVEAMKMGATDYLTKPFEEEALELAIENASKSNG